MVDWQAYDDGRLPRSEMRAIRKRLKHEPALLSEYEGYSQFKKNLRVAALKQPVPRRKLEAMLRELCGPQRAHVSRSSPAVVIALVCVIALALVSLGLSLRDVEPQPASFETHDAYQAREWAASKSGLNLPVVQLGDVGELVGSHAGRDWATYNYSVGDERFTLWMRRSRQCSAPANTWYSADGVGFYESQNVGFAMSGINFEVAGGDVESRRRLAYLISQECSTCPLFNREQGL